MISKFTLVVYNAKPTSVKYHIATDSTFYSNIKWIQCLEPFKSYVTLRGEGCIGKNVTERDRGVGGLLLRYVTQGCQHMNKWIY